MSKTRIWRVGCCDAARWNFLCLTFVAGSLQLFQVVFTRSGRNALPMAREHVCGTDDLQPRGPRMRSVK